MRVTLGFKLSWKEYVLLLGLPLFFLAGVFYLINTPARYQLQASAVLVQDPNIQAQAGMFRGLSPLVRRAAILSFRQHWRNQRFNRSLIIATLNSHVFLKSFIAQHQLKPIIFARRWDKQHQRWIRPKLGWFGQLLQYFYGKSTPSGLTAREPSDYLAVKRLKTAFHFKLLPRQRILQMTLIWPDKVQGRNMLNTLVNYANVYMLERTRQQTQDELSNYQQMLVSTSNLTMKQLLLSHQQQSLSTLLLQNVQMSPILSLIDPAVLPNQRYYRFAIIPLVAVWLFFSLLVFCLIMINRVPKVRPSV
ncbi:hypothetical protein [Celerinatantimonas yamalensis]|uniref:Subunit length determinant protein n=1 Tax=Celerinatantimonas yamalensis TaxID=559956 RepID=A0ABW9G838_9GAMM